LWLITYKTILAERALPFMVIVLGCLLILSSIFLPSMDSFEIDVSNLLPEKIEVPIASYSFNISIDNPLVGKVTAPVEIGGSKVTLRLSDIIGEKKIGINIGALSYVLIAIRAFLILTGVTLIITGLAVRLMLSRKSSIS